MNLLKSAAVILIIAGTLGLVYGSFTYTKDSHKTVFGPFEMSVKEKETVDVPKWAGAGAIALGVVLLLVGGKRRG